MFLFLFLSIKINKNIQQTAENAPKIYSRKQITISKERSVSISNCKFLNCSSKGDISAAMGGALHISHTLGPIIKLHIDTTIFIGCKSQSCAGALYVRCGQMEMNECCFNDCASVHTQTYFIYTRDNQTCTLNFTSVHLIFKHPKLSYQSFMCSQYHGIIQNENNNFTKIAINGHNSFGNYRMFDAFSFSYCTMTNSSGVSLLTLFHKTSQENCKIVKTEIIHNSLNQGYVFHASSQLQISYSIISDNNGKISDNTQENIIDTDGESFLNDQWSDIALFFQQKFISKVINTKNCFIKTITPIRVSKTTISTVNIIGSFFSVILIIVCLIIIYRIRKIIHQRKIDFMSIPEAYRMDDLEFESEPE